MTVQAAAVEAAEQTFEQDSPPEPTSRQSTDPSLTSYIREISKVPLLRRDQEVLLFTTLYESREAVSQTLLEVRDLLSDERQAVLAAQTPRYEDLSELWASARHSLESALGPAKTASVRRHLATWNAARERILRANLRLVIFTVKRFRNEPTLFMDLVQEGNIGLMRAVDRYDLDRSLKFSTYALWWIWQAVNRAYTKNINTVRIPVYKVQEVGRFNREKRAMTAELKRTPTNEELAARTGMDPEAVREVSELQANAISLDNDPDDSTGGILSNLVCEEAGPDDRIVENDMQQLIRDALDILPDRERNVLRWRYGVDSDVHTLKEIGARLSVSRERVRQLEQQALKRLRNSDFVSDLSEYARGD